MKTNDVLPWCSAPKGEITRDNPSHHVWVKMGSTVGTHGVHAVLSNDYECRKCGARISVWPSKV